MPNTNFNDPKQRERDNGTYYLEVSGPISFPWDPMQQVRGEITARFVLIEDMSEPDANGNPRTPPAGEIHGTAHYQPRPIAANAETGTWDDDWDGTVELGETPVRPGRYRTVGQLVMVRKVPGGPPADPPFFESIAWCVTRDVKNVP
jgi:hypothetical protein